MGAGDDEGELTPLNQQVANNILLPEGRSGFVVGGPVCAEHPPAPGHPLGSCVLSVPLSSIPTAATRPSISTLLVVNQPQVLFTMHNSDICMRWGIWLLSTIRLVLC